MTPVFDCTTGDAPAEAIEAAAAAVRGGRLVVLPTDTVYGVGADAFDPGAVSSLLAAKGRGREMPPPVLVPDLRTVDGLATDIPEYARRLMAEFWPGALTLVLRAQASLMWDLGETNGTVGLRMPADPVALALLAQTGPLAVTSANLTGRPAATTITEAAVMLGPAVDVYLDAGTSRGGQASTIVDCTGAEPVVLRRGGVSEDDVRRVCAMEPDAPAAPDTATVAPGSAAQSSGADAASDGDASAREGLAAPDGPTAPHGTTAG